MADIWDPGDGTRWIYSPGLDIWTGWVPGEDGVWTHSRDEFRAVYPEAPAEEDG